MKAYEIRYTYEGKQHTTIERPSIGWEEDFDQQVLNRIESLVMAGAVITDLRQI